MSDLILEPTPDAPPAAAAPAPTKPPAKETAKETVGGGVKETIESILVAFILAFVFRAFVVEAFVIPTGSMATTLLGAHTHFTCPDCGYGFDLNYSPPTANGGSEDDDVSVPSNAGRITTPIYCPNCGFQMPDEQVKNPPVAYGDRILVLKYLYLLQHPKRWDVVVFKAPTNPNQNFIKRLTGLPGEGVMVLDGDIYIRPPNDPDPMHFEVQPKPPLAQAAMWRLVYDNDFHPNGDQDRGSYPWVQPWKLQYGMCQQDDPATDGRAFLFDDLKAEAKLAYDVDADPAGQGLSDYLVYNQNFHQYNREPGGLVVDSLAVLSRSSSGVGNGSDTPVSDLDVRLTYQRTAGDGPFRVALTKRDHTFTAELTPTTATLFMDVGAQHTAIGHPFALPSGGRPVRIELSNADYQVTLRVDGSIVAQTSRVDYQPDIAALVREYDDRGVPPRPTITIRAADQQCRVSHLSLWRDVYYLNRGVSWATPMQFPNKTQQLGADEYFTMGDNSQLSYDARCWPEGIHLPAEALDVSAGRVPGRFLLGKAFYVYWPAGHRPADWLPSFIPDFQGMRLIH